MMSLGLAAAGAAGAVAPSDQAARSDAPPSDEIVVRAKEREVIRKFVGAIVDPAKTDQIPRWADSICSGVVGLQPDQAELINNRIGQLAGSAHLHLEPEGCRPSILILFTSDAPELARGLAQRFPNSLGHDGRWRLEAFVHSRQPVRWISGVDVSPFDGRPVIAGRGEGPDKGRLSGSLIEQSTRTRLTFMLILVDTNAVRRVSVGQLSDYLAMVALTRPKFGAKASGQSVLSLFDGDPPLQIGLRDYDRSYLASLYKAPETLAAAMQASTLRTSMNRNPPPVLPPAGTPSGNK